MKIQCACGAKYAFDVTPEMVENPVRFVCQNCGLDSSDYVNGLIRQELGVGIPVTPPSPPAAPPPPARVFSATPHLRIASAAGSAGPTVETAAGSEAPQYCLRHGGELCTQRCVVCQKPICPKCMEHFGFVCSPLCKSRAEARKINVPVYEGQKWVVEAQYWQKVGKISTAVGAGVAALLGLWFWYAWFGSVPHPVFSVRFADSALSGQSTLCGKNQIVFLHGNTLARYNISSKKEIWSHPMIDPQLIKDAVARANGNAQAVAALASEAGNMDMGQFVEQAMEEGMQLQANGSNVWVSAPGKLTHYDWDTGKVLQEIPLAGGMGEMIPQGNELLMMGESETGQQRVTHVNLATGELRTEDIGQPEKPADAPARNASGKTVVASARGAGGSPAAGLPLRPGANAGKALDPEKVAEQAQSLPLPARIALPALLANSMHQERIMQEADDGEDDAHSRAWQNALASRMFENPWIAGVSSFIPSEFGSLQLGVRILQTNIVTRDAMKAPPAKSVLDSGNLNVTKTADVANEILNEMQRNRGGNTVSEDESRYQVTIHRPDSTDAADWTGEVVGPPALFSLKTVNVLTSGKTVTVLDKTNKKLWQATLAYSVPAGAGILDEEGGFGARKSPYGEGPCIEHGNTLYVFDQAVLTAFDLATGNARWRLPSVGIAGLFFDDKGMLYVNSTTASPENIKFSRQIDINQKTDAIFLKVDPKNGRILWKAEPGNFISYLSGKFIYTYYVNYAGDDSGMADLAGITPTPSFVRIRRINPRNGDIMWDYQQKRAPLNLQFNGNTIELVFRKEVQVLKFLSL
jgi:outer membrane protein assembly factor BamB